MGRNLSLILIFGITIICSCAAFAATGYASINALGRNPSSAPKIFTAMIISLVFTQAVAFVVLLVVFQLFSAS